MAVHRDTSRDTGSVLQTSIFVLNTVIKKYHSRCTAIYHLYLAVLAIGIFKIFFKNKIVINLKILRPLV